MPQFPGSAFDLLIQVIRPAPHEQSRGEHPDHQASLDHGQVANPEPVHHLDGGIPASIGANRVRVQRHPRRNGKIAPARGSRHHSLQQIAFRKNSRKAAIGMDDDERPDAAIVHEPKCITQREFRRNHDRFRLHDLANGEKRFGHGRSRTRRHLFGAIR
ncbi:MAG: hypothetical protein U0792_13250 [Gemmataceae bacterium]